MTSGCPVDSHEAPAFPFPRDPTRPLDPAPQLEPIRLQRPIGKVTLWNGKQAWLVTRLEDARAVLGDLRFSSVATHENYPMISAGVAASKTQDASFLRKDPPVHTQHRMMWQAFFTPKHIAGLRPSIQARADEAIDALLAAGPPADLVTQLALPVPSRIISELLAVPEEDHEFFQDYSAIRGGIGSTPEAIGDNLARMDAYWDRRIDERLAAPGDDLVSRLITSEVKTGRITKDDLIAMAQLMLLAGHDTTAKMIGLGTLTLLNNPQVVARMQADPSVTPAVVDELLRYLTIAQNGLQRAAIDDVEIGGVKIARGEGVIVHLPSANRDEAAFAEAGRIDLERPSKRHVAFGAGPHVCIGAPLARAELQIVFDTLFRRIPDLRLATPLTELSFVNSLFYGVEVLPVAW